MAISDRISDNYKIKGGEQCSKVKENYLIELAAAGVKNKEVPSDLTSNYNLCGGDGESIIIEDVEAGKIIVNRGNGYIDDCKDEALTITKEVDRLKVNKVDGKCQKLADKYLDTYKIDNKDTHLFMKDEYNNNGIPGLVNVTEQNYTDFRNNWRRKYDRAKDESLCKGVTATNINDYNASMNKHYAGQIKYDQTSLLNINKTMFNDQAGQHAIQGKGPTWLDMNFLSCDREDYETLSIGEKVKAKYINDHPFKSGWYGAQIKNTKDKWNAVCRNPQEPCCGMGVLKPVNEKTDKEIKKEIKKIEGEIQELKSKRNGDVLKGSGYSDWKKRYDKAKNQQQEKFCPIPEYEKGTEIIRFVDLQSYGEEGIIRLRLIYPDGGSIPQFIDDNGVTRGPVTVESWLKDVFEMDGEKYIIFDQPARNYPIDIEDTGGMGVKKTFDKFDGGFNSAYAKKANKAFKNIADADNNITDKYARLLELKNLQQGEPKICKCESKKYRTNPELFNDIIDKNKQGCNEMLDGLEYSIQFDNEGEVDMTDSGGSTERWRTIDELKTGASWYINNRNNIHKDNKNIKQESGLIDNILKNDSDLDNTNLFTGFSDKLFGCKTKSRNINSERKTYTMDWNRLDDMGKLKYGFKGEDLHMKILSLTDKIKQKKNISTLFYIIFNYVIIFNI